jgi:hypothetical protein
MRRGPRAFSELLRSLAALALAGLLASCATTAGRNEGARPIEPGSAAARRLAAIPSTLLLRRDREPARDYCAAASLAAARGEAESIQLAFVAGPSDEEGLRFAASPLLSPGGSSIEPELGLVGYVPLRRPSLLGFREAGDYPDPILPNAAFSARARTSQALWYTVTVPRDAAPGLYAGTASVIDRSGRELSLPLRLRVYDVELPRTSFLKTSINFRGENYSEERYYGAAWSAQMAAALPREGLKYRFSPRVDLPLPAAILDSTKGAAGTGPIEADWSAFDAAAELWLAEGISCFELKLGITWKLSPKEIDARYGRALEAIDAHIVAKGWTELFYFYFYDEPSVSEMYVLRQRLDAIRAHAPAIRNLLTYGTNKAGQWALLGRVGIWVPNLHQLDPAFARSRRGAGDEVWAYACVGNAFRGYPDNFRVDWYGAAHRALGWWLYANGAQGFLYWAVDLWRVDPWTTTETFPFTNGDGVLFYPAPDKVSAPYPSIRAHLMREAFEDYDLLRMLELAYGDAASGEVRELLASLGLREGRADFSKDDEAYLRAHARMLELLEAARTK